MGPALDEALSKAKLQLRPDLILIEISLAMVEPGSWE